MTDREERELKLAIADLESYRRIRDALPGFEGELRLVNHYLDGDDLPLVKRKVMLRVRTCEGHPGGVVTLKSGTTVADGYFRSQEDEEPLTGEEVDLLLRLPAACDGLHPKARDVVRSALALLGEGDLKVVGKLVNLRRNYRLAPEIVVELDLLSFPDGSQEFELEIETGDPESARRLLDPLLTRLGIGVTPRSETKFQRLLARARG